MGDYVNDTWAYEELIPFLLTVFGDREGYQWRGIGDWETSIEIAERNLNRIVSIRAIFQLVSCVSSSSTKVPWEHVMELLHTK
jgi:hypothetical protein